MSDAALHTPPEVIAPFDRSERTTSSRSTRILNGRFDRLSGDQVVEELIQTVHAGQRGTLCTVNVAILMMMRSDQRIQRFVDSAKWTVADGQPLIWASHLAQQPLPERVTGIDLIDQLCARAARENIGVYFLGASDKIVRATADALRSRHPGLDVRGYADGYFGPDEAPARARAVAASGAELLFVAMGVPRRILHRGTMGAPWCAGRHRGWRQLRRDCGPEEARAALHSACRTRVGLSRRPGAAPAV